MKYYDIQKNWRIVRNIVQRNDVQGILVRDFNRFTWGRWRQKFSHGDLPTEFESCDWRYSTARRGRQPAFWDYTKHSACHWLVNFNLAVAERAIPNKAWRIITSDLHSSVWDGDSMLMDFNFSAMGIDPQECFDLACGEILEPGQQYKTHMAQFWKTEIKHSQERLAAAH